jgi:hypothetical protein
VAIDNSNVHVFSPLTHLCTYFTCVKISIFWCITVLVWHWFKLCLNLRIFQRITLCMTLMVIQTSPTLYPLHQSHRWIPSRQSDTPQDHLHSARWCRILLQTISSLGGIGSIGVTHHRGSQFGCGGNSHYHFDIGIGRIAHVDCIGSITEGVWARILYGEAGGDL